MNSFLTIIAIIIFRTELVEAKMIQPKDLSKHIGQEITLSGRAEDSGWGPILKMNGGSEGPGPNENKVFVLNLKKPQTFELSVGQGPSIHHWPKKAMDGEIHVVGRLKLRPLPEGYVIAGSGEFVKHEKKGPGEYVLENAHWSAVKNK